MESLYGLTARGRNWSATSPHFVPAALAGDAARLRQMLDNFVNNAVKFTEQGEIVIETDAVPDQGSKIVLGFAVRDSGIGIADGKQAVIFEPFRQSDGSTTRQYGGTSLGLSIAQQLVELIGGRIWLESQLGKGNTFHFTVRLKKQANVAGSVTRASMRGDFARLSRVVIDDNSTARLVSNEMLCAWGLVVTESSTTLARMQGLKLVRDSTRPFRLVLLDRSMPTTDGSTMAKWPRDDPDIKATSVTMLTSDKAPTDIARDCELGIANYLIKPIKQTELRETILNVIRPELSIAKSSGEQRREARAREGRKDCLVSEAGPRVLLAEDNAVG